MSEEINVNELFGGSNGYVILYMNANNDVVFSEILLSTDIDADMKECRSSVEMTPDLDAHLRKHKFCKKVIFKINALEYTNTAEFAFNETIADGALDAIGRTMNEGDDTVH